MVTQGRTVRRASHTKTTTQSKPSRVFRGATRSVKSSFDWQKLCENFQTVKNVINWRTVALCLIISLAVLLGRIIVGTLYAQFNQPLVSVEVEGELNFIDKSLIVNPILHAGRRGILSLDLLTLKDELESLAFVESVSLERKWPDTVVVSITEYLPIAKWADGRLLIKGGALISPRVIDDFAFLPLLKGPEGTQLKVLAQYETLSLKVNRLAMYIDELELLPRGAWRMSVDGEVSIALGKGFLDEKLARFRQLYKTVLNNSLADVVSIDLRYPNGIAVKWRKKDSINASD